MKKLYLLLVTLFVVIATNVRALGAESQSLKLTLSNYSTSVETDLTVDATIEDGVITIPNFLGGTQTVAITVNSLGKVSLTIDGESSTADYFAASINQEIEGVTYGRYRFYQGYLAYYTNDGEYVYVSGYADVLDESGEKTSSTWFDSYLYVPEGFEKQQADYQGMPFTLKATITSGDDGAGYGTSYFDSVEVDVAAYINGNVITIPNYLGGTTSVVYTIGDDNTIADGVAAGYTYTDFTQGETNFYCISAYGGKATYDADAKTISDEYYIYVTDGNGAYSYFKVTLQLPDLTTATATVGRDSSTFDVAYVLGDAGTGKITFPNFLGSELSPTYTISEDGSVSNDILEGDYYSSQLGELGAYSVYLSYDSYTTLSYAVTNGVKVLTIKAYYEGSSSKLTLAVTLPDEFTPLELEKNVTAYAVVDGEETGDPIKLYMKTTTSGYTVTISNPFSTTGFSLPFIMEEDGEVYCTGALGGWYTKNSSAPFLFNDKTYLRLYDIARKYDVDNKVFIWTIGLEETPQSGTPDLEASSIDRYNLYIELPSKYKPSEPLQVETLDTRIFTTTAHTGKLIPAESTTTVVNTKQKENRKVNLMTFLSQSADVDVTWDEEGNVTTTAFPVLYYYTLNRKYYTSITIGEGSKYVKNDEDEYIDLVFNTGSEYYGSTTYTDASLRIYFSKTSADLATTTVYAYDADEDSEDSSSYTSLYTLKNSEVTIEDLLEFDYPLTLHVYATADGTSDTDDQEATTNLPEGTIEGTFYALGNTYSTLTYHGDEENAGWYAYSSSGGGWSAPGGGGRKTYYGFVYVVLDEGKDTEKEVEITFTLPSSISFDKANKKYDVEVVKQRDATDVTTDVARGYVENSTLTISDFASLGKSLALTLYEDGAVVATLDGSEVSGREYSVEGTFALGGYELSNIKINANNIAYKSKTVTVESTEESTEESTDEAAAASEDEAEAEEGEGETEGEGEAEAEVTETTVYYFQVPVTSGQGRESTQLYVNIYVPDGVEGKEYEKNVEIHEVVDGEESTDATLLHWTTSVSGATLTVTKPFSAARVAFPFTMHTDGSVTSTYGMGNFTDSYTFDEVSYQRLRDSDRAYDVEGNRFVWTLALCQTETVDDVTSETTVKNLKVYVSLPEDFAATYPEVLETLKAVLVKDERNGREFVAATNDVTVNVYAKEQNDIIISKLFGQSISIPVKWDAEGNVTVDESATYSTSGYMNDGSDYYQKLTVASEGSKYVKNDVDEYIQLAVTLVSGYYYKENSSFILRAYFTLGSELPTDGLLSVYVSAYDSEGEETDYDEVLYYYEVVDGNVVIKNFLDGDNDLTVTYYDDYSIKTTLTKGTNSGLVYVLDNQFSSFEYDGDDSESAGWDDYEYSGTNYPYTYIYISNGDNDYGVTYYNPSGIVYNEADAVNDIVVDAANGEVEYFNLQGIRVANPANGIYIRRQGNTATKVLVR